MPEPADAAPERRVAADAAPERRVAADLARRGLLVGPLLVLICALVWGIDGLWSALLALGLVVLNFLFGAAIIDWSVRIAPNLLMAGVLGGYILRLGILTAVVLAVRNAGWFDAVPFAVVLLVLHLGLLVWELRHVAASLAHPGLHPGTGLFRSGARRRSRRTPQQPSATAANVTEGAGV